MAVADEQYFGGQKFISSKKAGTVAGYSSDYIGQLCRERRVVARLIDKTWYVEEASLISYQQEALKAMKMRGSALTQWDGIKSHYLKKNDRVVYEKDDSSSMIPALSKSENKSSLGDVDALAEKLVEKLSARGFNQSHGIQPKTEGEQIDKKKKKSFSLGKKIFTVALALVVTAGAFNFITNANRAGFLSALKNLGQSIASVDANITGVSPLSFVGNSLNSPSQVAAVGSSGFFDTLFRGVGNYFAGLFGDGEKSNVTPNEPQTTKSSSPPKPSDNLELPTEDKIAERVVNQLKLSGLVVESPSPRIVERVVIERQLASSGGVTEELLATRLTQTENSLKAEIYKRTAQSGSGPNVSANYFTTAPSNRIDTLTNVSISGATIIGSSFGGGGGIAASSGSFSGDLTVSGATTLSTLSAGITSLGTTTTTNLIVTNNSTSTFQGGLTVGISNLVIDQNTGFVGIGTTTPGSKLSVAGDAYFDGNLSSTNITATGTASVSGLATLSGGILSTAASSTIANLSTTNATSTNATSTNLFTVSSVWTSATGTNLYSENSVFSNATSTNLAITNIASTSALTVSNNSNLGGTLSVAGLSTLTDLLLTSSTTLQNFTFVNATGTNATTTNFFSTTLTATNSFINSLLTSANLLLTGSTTLQNFTAVNSTTTSATTTSLFSTTASSTNLFSQTASLGTLTVPGLTTLSSLSSGTSTLTNLIVTNTSTSTFAGAFSVSGSGYIVGGFGIGIATTTPGTLETSGNAYIGGNLTVIGNSTTLGESSANTLTINSAVKSHIIPSQNNTYDLGSPSYYWRNVYVDTITANSISAGSTDIGGTNSNTLTINTNNVTSDTEDMSLIFYRGVVIPNAVLSWNSTSDRFEFNQSIYLENASASTTLTTFDIKGVSGQTADIFRVSSSTGTNLFNLTSSGNLGIGTSSPFAKLSVGGDGYISGDLTSTNITATGTASISGLSTLSGGILSTASSTIANLSTTNGTTTNATTTNLFSSTASSTNLFSQTASIGTLTVSSTTIAELNITNSTSTNLHSTNASVDSLTVTSATSTNFFSTTASSTNLYSANANLGTLSAGTLSLTTALTVANGGTGSTSFGQGWLYSDGGTTSLSASTSPTVNYITATSSTATSTFAGFIDVNGTGTNATSTFASNLWIKGTLQTGTGSMYLNDTGLTSSDGNISFLRNATSTLGTNGLTIGTNQFVVQQTSGNVGIGKSNPVQTLDVVGSGAFTGALSSSNLSGTNTGDVTLSGENYLSRTNQVITANAVDLSGTNATGVLAAGRFPSLSGDLTTVAGALATTLATVNSNVGSFGSSTAIPTFTVNGKGLITAASTAVVIAPAGTLTGTTLASNVVTSSLTAIGTLSSGAVPASLITAGTFGTGNYIFSGNASTTQIGSTGNAYFATAGGNVGIGTTGAGNLLHLSGISGSAAETLFMLQDARTTTTATPNYVMALNRQNSATSALYLGNDGNGDAIVAANNANLRIGKDVSGTFSEYVRIDTNGNVGIGTTSPMSVLSLQTTGNTVLTMKSGTSVGNVPWIAFDNPSGRMRLQYQDASGSFTSDGLGIYDETGAAWRAFFTRSGNVGIGTTSPTTILDISRSTAGFVDAQITNTNSTAADNTQARFVAKSYGDTSGVAFGKTISTSPTWAGNAFVWNAENTALMFATNNTERIRITAGGNVGIGTTSPQVALSVVGNARFGGTAVPTGTAANVDVISGSGTNALAVWDDNSLATPRFVVQRAGNVGIGTTGPVAKLNVGTNTTSTSGDVSTIAQFGGSSSGATVTALSLVNSATGAAGNSAALSFHTGSDYSSVGQITSATDSTSPLQVSMRFTTYDSNSSALTEKMRITGPGNVGIGTTNPSLKFVVSNAGAQGFEVNPVAPSITGGVDMVFYNRNTSAYAPAYFDASVFDFARGNVGIGTTNPAQKLEIANGNLRIGQTSATSSILFGSAATDYAEVSYQDATGALWIGNKTGNGYPLILQGVSGNVGIGTTTPKAPLQIGSGATGLTFATNIAAQVGFNQYYSGGWKRVYGSYATGIGMNEGTIGDIGFFTAGSDVADSAITWSTAMIIKNGGNVGIGTTAPGASLDVRTDNTKDSLNLYDRSGVLALAIDKYGTFITHTGALTTSNTGVDMVFNNGSTETMRLQNGKVGIGTTAPTAKLTIGTAPSSSHSGGTLDVMGPYSSPDSNHGVAYFASSEALAADVGGKIVLGGKYTSTLNTTWAGISGFKENATSGEYGGYLQLWTRTNGQNLAPRMTINSSGNVGIGTANPSGVLHVYKNGTTDASLFVQNPNAGSGAWAGIQVLNDTGTLYLQAVGSGYGGTDYPNYGIVGANSGLTNGLTLYAGGASSPITFRAGGSVLSNEKMRITSAGYVGIGTTNPGEKLEISGAVIKLTNTGGGDTFGIANNNTTGFRLYDYTASLDRLVINSSGNVGIGTTNPNLAALTIERDMTNTNEGDAKTQIEIRGKTDPTLELLLGYNTESDYAYIQGNKYAVGGRNIVMQKYGGNVGIGTASPVAKLDVSGDATISTLTGSLFQPNWADNTGLVIYYKLDEGTGTTAFDYSGNANDGTFTNSPTWVSGKYVNAVDTGSGASTQYINVPNTPSIGSSWTIEAWTKFPLPSVSSYRTLTRSATNDHQVLVNSSNILGTYAGGGSGWVPCGFDVSTLSAGWHHFAAVGSGSATDFYIDGKNVCTSAFKSTQTVIAVGNYQGGGQPWGTFDEFRLYTRALAAEEIRTQYLRGSEGLGTSKATSAYRILTNNTERLRIDSSGNVGIGTTAPGARLDVQTTPYTDPSAMFGSSDNAAYKGLIYFNQNTINASYNVNSEQDLILNNVGYQNGTTQFRNLNVNDGKNGSYAFFQGSSQSLGVGYHVTPSYTLDVGGDIRTSQCLRYNSGTLGSCSSDSMLKRDVTPYSSFGLTQIVGLKPVHFFYNGLGGNPDDGRPQLGLIAQDVEKVAPELVGIQYVKLHPGDATTTPVKTVNYSALTYGIINAIQELNQQISPLVSNISVDNKGNVVVGGTVSQISDIRLDTEVKSLDDSSGLSVIKKLNPVEYKTGDSITTQLGFVAQEVSLVLPNLVSRSGAVSSSTPDGAFTVNYIGFIPPLVKAVQELDTRTQDVQATSSVALAVGGTFDTASEGLRGLIGSISGKSIRVAQNSIYAAKGLFSSVIATEVHSDKFCVGGVCMTSGGDVGMGTTTPGGVATSTLSVGDGNISLRNGAVCVDDGTGKCNGSLNQGTVYAVNAFSQTLDLAESYPTKDATLSAGDIVSLDQENGVYVARANASATTSPVLGIISTKPGFYLGGFDDGQYPADRKIPVALSGRVPLKVSTENGTIKKGDRIALSLSTPGVGMKATTSGMTVGIALEDFDPTNGKNGYGTSSPSSVNSSLLPNAYGLEPIPHWEGEVMTFVNLSWARIDSVSGENILSDFWTMDNTTGRMKARATLDMNNFDLNNVKAITSASGKWSIDADGNLVAENLTVRGDVKVGSSANRTGITLYDEVTGEPYCLSISGGVTKSTVGECGVVQSENATTTASTTEASAPTLSVNGNPDTTSSQSSDGYGAGNPTPTIVVNGNNPSSIQVGDTYLDLGATITGPTTADTNLSIYANLDSSSAQSASSPQQSATSTGLFFTTVEQIHIDTTVSGTHTITYSATNQAGLTGTATRTVIVSDPAISQTQATTTPTTTATSTPTTTTPTSPTEPTTIPTP